jgi:hypothetical protein
LAFINDDSTGEQIAAATVQAAKECARMIGKIGPQFTSEQFEKMETAVMSLFGAIAERKKLGTSDSR